MREPGRIQIEALLRRAILGGPVRRALSRAAILLAITAVLVELGCQAYTVWLHREWEGMKTMPKHYYQPSANPRLVYELRRGYDVFHEQRHLHVNRHGYRDDSDDGGRGTRTGTGAAERVAILGDSVVFGIDLSQDETLPARVQERLDLALAPTAQRVKVVNVGVPGYGLAEMPDLLREADAVYGFSKVVYVLNPNDFSLRDSRWEGADNGIYRMYQLPLLKTPWFVRKAIYRHEKAQVDPTPHWYEWLYAGTKAVNLRYLGEMADYARGKGIVLSVLLLPVASCYQGQGAARRFLLADEYREIGAYCAAHGLRCVDVSDTFPSSNPETFEETDHFVAAGARAMADVVVERFLR